MCVLRKGYREMKKWKYGCALFLAVCVAASIIGTDPYRIADAFSRLGQGPDFLYKWKDVPNVQGEQDFTPGAQWKDEEGNLIQAHGGQVQYMEVPDENGRKKKQYVWIGENKSTGHFGNCFAVYTSDDLYHWECRGDVLRSIASWQQLTEDPYFTELYKGCSQEELKEIFSCIHAQAVMERPKMLYNAATDQYVIWFHSDDATSKNTYKYDVGMAGVAVSDSPFGPFRFLHRQRLSQCPKGEIDCYPFSKGEARDLNLFQDRDQTAYIVYTSENNKTLYISRLNESYTDLCTDPENAVSGKDFMRLFPGAMREAPVLIRGENGRYYLMSSSTTGWMSNQARVWSADSIFGTWQNDGNPCIGVGANVTFDSQSTCLFRAENGQWIYYGDRWNAKDLADSRYIWLPVQFAGERLTISWKERWRWEEP